MKTFLTCLFLVIPVMVIFSQSLTKPLTNNVPRGFQPGHILLTDSTMLQGYIKNNIRHWGQVILLQQDGRKTTYTASQLCEAVINQDKHLSIEGDWYTLVHTGKKINLLQKASSLEQGVQYNGSEAVGIRTGRGFYHDYYFQRPGKSDSLIWLSPLTVDPLVRYMMADCAGILANIKERRITMKEVPELVKQYNSCE